MRPSAATMTVTGGVLIILYSRHQPYSPQSHT